jgi:Plavaka transposase
VRTPDDWTPFNDRIEFEFADFIYHRNQMSAPDIDALLDIWAAKMFKYDDHPPFANHRDLYHTLDSTLLADVCWQNFTAQYQGDKPDDVVPPWMDATYEVWYRDPLTVVRELIGNPDFDKEFDYAPYREFEENGERRFQDFFSGDWAWSQVVQSIFVHSCSSFTFCLGYNCSRSNDAWVYLCTCHFGQ